MRMYFSGNLHIHNPEVIMHLRKPHIMLSFYYLSRLNPRHEDKGSIPRFKKLLFDMRRKKP